MWKRFPPRMRRAIAAAVDAAAARGCDEVSAEHLLLAVCQDAESAAVFLLERAGVGRTAVLAELASIAPSGPNHQQKAARLSPAALHVLDVAAGEATRLGHAHVSTGHVALALTITNHNGASDLLAKMGLTHDRAAAALAQWTADGASRRRASETPPANRWLDRLQEPVRRVLRLPSIGWKVFVGRSLGHPRFVTNPYPLYRWLRDRHPVRRDPLVPVYVVTRYADVATLLKDPRFRKDPFALDRLPAVVREQLGIPPSTTRSAEAETISMLFLDPPHHTRVRAFFTKAFTPRIIAGLRPRIERITESRLAKVRPTGTMDVIDAIAYPLPVIVIAELLGFPPEDYPLYKQWSDDFAAALGLYSTSEQQMAAAKSRTELRAYFDKLVEHHQRDGSSGSDDNLLPALLAMEHEEGALSRDELFINAALLLAAGHETTTNLIGTGLLALLRHPDQLAAAAADPSLIESTVEELLRFDSPVQWVSRVVGERMELGGVTLEPGAIMLGSLGAANRDGRQFADPDRLDVRRTDNRHLAFGSGIHYCLGAALARLEAQVALAALLRLPNLRLAQRRVRWKRGLIFRAVRQLNVRFDPVA
jgi:cytochrome P450